MKNRRNWVLKGPALSLVAGKRLIVATLLGISLLAPVQAAEPLQRLPMAAELDVAGELPQLLKATLLDYQDRLPDAQALEWAERSVNAQGQPVFTPRVWSEAAQRFGQTCFSAKVICTPLVAAQIRVMDRALRASAEAGASRASAATLSAISDLCAYAPAIAECPLNRRFHEAALQWLQLGRDALFVAWLDRYDAQRNQYLAWLKSQNTPPSASTLAALPDMPRWIRANYFELRGEFTAARELWLMTLFESISSRPSADQERLAAYRLARLSWRLGDAELAQDWQGYAASLPSTPAASSLPCWARHEQWRMDIARSSALHESPLQAPETLRGLIAADCPFSVALAEYGTDTLTGDLATIAAAGTMNAMLSDGLKACSTRCAPARAEALRILQQLVSPQPRQLAGIAAQQQRQLNQSDLLLEADVQLAWASGATLFRQPGLQAEGLTLLTALQEHLLTRNAADRFSSFGAQQNRSRFDTLHRGVALAATVQGMQLELPRLEAMRAQTLLRRLRLNSLAGELANVRDADAELRYQEVVTAMQGLVRQLDGLSGTDSRTQAIRKLTARMTEDALVDAQLLRLETLAARRLDGGNPEKAWLRTLGQAGALTGLDTRSSRSPYANGLSSLGADTAYLSWLRVPGGYVATIAWFDPGYYPAETPTKAGHRQRSRFIAVSEAQENTLKLYRELLMSGAAAKRGASLTETPVTDPGGLNLRGTPVWRTAERHYVAQASSPYGGERVRDLKEIGQSIYGLLLEPLHAQWEPSKRLLLSPDGLLTLLPFETLWAGDKPLLDLVDVSYVQSLQVHAELVRRAGKARAPGNRLLSIADPDYQSVSSRAATPLPDWMARLKWPPLPGTRVESEALKPLFRQTRLITGTEAARASLLGMQASRELQGFRILHFATHGYVDDQRSSLVLSTRDGMQQAYLLDSDISTLTLQTDLVLLSACDTGLGRQQNGEGVVGLPYAFMLAGNINTLMSLWPVDDAGTAAFMPAFMAKASSGVDLVTALNATKREFAAGMHGTRNSDPRIWAAFVQYGVPLQLK